MRRSWTTAWSSSISPSCCSLDFFLSGRSLPAWVTGLAFISANLGAVEIVGMSANGAQYGMATVHYFSSWPATNLSGFDNPFWSVVGIVFGLGFVRRRRRVRPVDPVAADRRGGKRGGEALTQRVVVALLAA